MTEQNTQAEKIAPDQAAMADALRKISANVADIRSRVEAIEQSQASHSDIREHETRESSRLVITSLFGALGAKLGFASGVKLVAFEHGKNSMGTGATFMERMKNFDWGKFFDVKEVFGNGAQFKKAATIAAISTAAGTALGITVGWMRGRRIKEPKDMLEHPIQTIRTLAMSEKSYQEQEAREQAAKKHGRTWQEKVSAPAEQAGLSK